MTAGKSLRGEPGPAQRAVALDGFDRVVRAARLEATSRREPRRERATDTRESRAPAASSRARSRRACLPRAANGGAGKPRELCLEARVGQLARQPPDRSRPDRCPDAERASTRAKPFSNPALHPVAHHRVAHLATDRDPQAILPGRPRLIRFAARHTTTKAVARCAATAPDHLLELHGAPQSIDRLETAGLRRHRLLRRGRDCDALATLRPPSLEDVATRGGLHALAKTVDSLAPDPARLIRALHRSRLTCSSGPSREGASLLDTAATAAAGRSSLPKQSRDPCDWRVLSRLAGAAG